CPEEPSMRTEQPQTIYLTDYRQPDYLIDETHLTFELFEDHALVHSRLLVRLNDGCADGTLCREGTRHSTTEGRVPSRPVGVGAPPLVLHGQELELVSVSINDQAIDSSDYQVDEHSLTLHPQTADFELAITTRIQPQNNTALEGLFKSGGMFCTQCEAEGFRKITYYLDRPDVMSRFTTTVMADRGAYPILLSNGNLIASGEHEGGRHWATWEDPFPKPSYLFALVAGDLCLIQDSYTTLS